MVRDFLKIDHQKYILGLFFDSSSALVAGALSTGLAGPTGPLSLDMAMLVYSCTPAGDATPSDPPVA